MKKSLLLLLMTLSAAALAQQRITGKVTSDTDGTPLPGVSVILKGSSGKGTLTDSEGKYNIEAATSDILVFSIIGLRSKELTGGTESNLDVPMEESMNELSEIVVTGTRSVGRTTLETPVPVDVISIED